MREMGEKEYEPILAIFIPNRMISFKGNFDLYSNMQK